MKKVVTILLIALLSFSGFAQDGEANIPVDIQTSEVFKDNRKYTSLAFSTKDKSGGVILGRRHKKGYYIEHYNSAMKLTGSFDFEMKKYTGLFQEAFISGNDLALIERFYNKESKEIEYFVHKSPLGSFNFTKKLLFSIPKKKARKLKISFFRPKITMTGDGDIYGKVTVSPNQKYITITFDIVDADKETHKIFVYDNNLNEVYKTEFIREIKDWRFKLENVDIDESDGTVYLLGKVYTRNKEKKKEGGKYQFELYKINGTSQESVVFDSGDKYIGSLTTIVNNDKVVCVGFYSERKDNRYKGFVHFKINPKTLAIESSKYSPFTKQFIQDKYGKDKDTELRNISFRDIIVSKDGDIIINAEEFYIVVMRNQNSNSGFTSTTTRYHYRDIISAKISPDGDLIWARNINKKQVADFPSSYFSYTSTYTNDKVYLFLNCADKVRRIRADRLQFKGTKAKRSNLYVITIDAKGDFEYKKIIDDKDSEVPFAVGRGFVNEYGNQILFQGRRGKKKQILKLSL